jgi:hypothetical protein
MSVGLYSDSISILAVEQSFKHYRNKLLGMSVLEKLRVMIHTRRQHAREPDPSHSGSLTRRSWRCEVKGGCTRRTRDRQLLD